MEFTLGRVNSGLCAAAQQGTASQSCWMKKRISPDASVVSGLHVDDFANNDAAGDQSARFSRKHAFQLQCSIGMVTAP